MKKILPIITVLIAIILSSCSKEIPRSNLVMKDGIAYKKGASEPYSGKVFSIHNNEKRKEEVTYLEGRLSGPFKVWSEFGLSELDGNWLDGKKNGNWIEYYENGEKHFSGEYFNDEESGLWTRYNRGGNPEFTFDYEAKCKKLNKTRIDELLELVKNAPLEPVAKNEVAVLETNFGKMVIGFFPDKAPQHASSFKRLVKAGFYDCTTFHRIIENFMIQGGDVATRYAGSAPPPPGPGYSLNAEFNDIPHEKGVLSMARSTSPHSAGSQFFICLSRERTEHLDGKYTVFGRVLDGLDILERIGSFEVKMSPIYNAPVLPVHPVYIKKAYMQVQT
jgi:peptidyl-prolyl cis-trans isomerase B (cyclophilin B)